MKNPLQLIDRRSLIILAGSFVLVTLISVIAIVLSVSSRQRAQRMSDEARRSREEQALSSSTSFGMEDFYLSSIDPDSPPIHPLREPRRFWTQEEVEFYWIDPSDAGLDTLSESADKSVFESLNVPYPEKLP